MTDQAPTPPPEAAPYRVLARKYRPTTFAELVGQEALVRTLGNAIATGRIAQAFMLTGVRGVGKTTTARILARALNCIGPDGRGGPTVSPCGVCEPCLAILQDRFVDVLEMDAASHTGVEDIRDIISGVRYAPVSARYKLYIIDEVHMLSRNAFNALLKTLEEPPSHVKFVFATTEIRKVPVTVLSRCQRFDLRRVATPVLINHFRAIAGQESVSVDEESLALIARAADGSVRDGLSLLDQAIARAPGGVEAEQVRDMLGLADRVLVLDLLEAAMSGHPPEALAILAGLHLRGADSLVVLRDLLDLVHFLTRAKLVPDTLRDPATPEAERQRGGTLAGRLTMPVLTRAWQLLLKGLNEVQSAPVPAQALEMVLIRLAYAADLPTPADLVRQIQGQSGKNGGGGGGGNVNAGTVGGGGVQAGLSGSAPRPGLPTGPSAMNGAAMNGAAMNGAAMNGGTVVSTQAGASAMATAAQPHSALSVPATAPKPVPSQPRDFRALAQLFAQKREGTLYGHLYGSVHLVRCEPGLLELRLRPGTPRDIPNRVGSLLTEWTGRRWMVAVSEAPGQPTLAEQDAAADEKSRHTAENHPLVRAVLEAFPGAHISSVVNTAPPAAPEPEAPDQSAPTEGDAAFPSGYSFDFDEDGDFDS